ncbi:probable RNA methyltransferase CG11342 [Periplaneta americana]|uniref:probable RNA methyltransferase CG11342 n=1 Tax=Periplaneta americana TaxID=6978 RepID=UPI0037E91D02
MAEHLKFKGGDPGAVKHGNFINYYQFNSAKNRLELLPLDIWNVNRDRNYICLDIGCNSGVLTQELFKFVSGCLPGGSSCHILGVDLDPVLIERADRANDFPQNVTYRCVDYMQDTEQMVPQFLQWWGRAYFDATFCFAVTMWIHLNHGDEGLRRFLVGISHQTRLLIVEPQPWKCYRSAVRRLRRSGEEFPEFAKLQLRGDVTQVIEDILLNECNLTRVNTETHCTSWGRKLLIFKNTR